MKTFFYIAGGVLVIGAIALLGYVFLRPAAPQNQNPGNGGSGSTLPTSSSTQTTGNTGGTGTTGSGTPSPVDTSMGTSTNTGVQNAFVSQIQNGSQVTTGNAVIYGGYAVQIWGDENKGGEALLKQDASGNWKLLSLGGGAWDVNSLVHFGVPQATAQALVNGLQ